LIHVTGNVQVATDVKAPAFYRFGGWVARHRWPVLIGYLVVFVIVGVFGVRVFGAMQTGGFDDPASDSARAATVLAEEFGTRDPVVVLAIESPEGVDASATQAQALLDDIGQVSGVSEVVSYWSTGGAPTLLSEDGLTTRAFVYADEGADTEKISADIVDTYAGQQGDVFVYAFGNDVVGNAFTDTITGDLARAESIAIPITALILLFVFGSVVAAGLPFLVAGGTILGSFFALWIVSTVTDVSVFSLNLVTGLGLALGIDYSLLIISRFREELSAGKSVPDAVAATVGSAGKTVCVSGITVAFALAALLIYPQYFLRSFAYAGIAVSFLAIAGALTAIPALLGSGEATSRPRTRACGRASRASSCAIRGPCSSPPSPSCSYSLRPRSVRSSAKWTSARYPRIIPLRRPARSFRNASPAMTLRRTTSSCAGRRAMRTSSPTPRRSRSCPTWSGSRRRPMWSSTGPSWRRTPTPPRGRPPTPCAWRR